MNTRGSFSKRIEKKILIQHMPLSKVEIEIMKHNFFPIHTKRTVNSLYYDTTDFKCYKDSSEGIVPRKKYRIRSYDNSKNLQLEIKYQDLDGKYKKNIAVENYKKYVFDKDYGNLEQKLFVRYKRKYFSNNFLRLTLDWNINFEKLNGQNDELRDHIILELKPITEFNVQSEYMSNNIFNIPEISFSKYEEAVKNLFD